LGLGAERWWQKAVGLAGALLMLHVVFFSFSRGGMLAAMTLLLVSFVLVPKRPRYNAIFALVVLLALRLAGPEVRDRFATALLAEGERDFSAQSRLDLWGLCWELMLKHPGLGVGPDHFPLVVYEYGWPAGKEAHTLWLQTGAELGFPGLLFLVLFYGMSVVRLLPLTRTRGGGHDPSFAHLGRMVIAGLMGFVISAQFVTIEALELPYYIALVGAGVLKLASSRPTDAPAGDSSYSHSPVQRSSRYGRVEGARDPRNLPLPRASR
jgi:putative inorganic carbon (hco3(-)) transporter